MSNANQNQKDADKFDLDLHRLMRRCEQLSGSGGQAFGAQWGMVGEVLRTARGRVRSMMDPKRREETE